MSKRTFDLPEIGALLIGALFVFGVVLYISNYAVNVPFWDDWDVQVDMFVEGDFANLNFDRLARFHNQHRYLTTRLFVGLLDLVDPLNSIKYLYVLLGLSVAIFALLYLTYRKHTTSKIFYLVSILFAALLYEIALWDTYTNTPMLPNFIALFWNTLALWAIFTLQPGWRTLSVAVTAASLSALGFVPGNIFLVGMGALMVLAGWRNWRHYAVWGVATAIMTVWYIVDVLRQPSLAEVLQPVPLGTYIQFTLLYIISPLRFVSQVPANYGVLTIVAIASLIGFGVVVWFNIKFVEDGWRKSLPWLGLAGWSVATGAAAAIGRAGYIGGLADGLAPRYQIFGLMFWLALVALLWLALTEPRPTHLSISTRRWLPVTILFIVGLLYVRANFYDLMNDMRWQYERLTTGYECLRDLDTATDECLENLYPNAERLRYLMTELKRRNPRYFE